MSDFDDRIKEMLGVRAGDPLPGSDELTRPVARRAWARRALSASIAASVAAAIALAGVTLASPRGATPHPIASGTDTPSPAGSATPSPSGSPSPVATRHAVPASEWNRPLPDTFERYDDTGDYHVAAFGTLWLQDGRQRHPDPTSGDCGSCYPSREPGSWADELRRLGTDGRPLATLVPRHWIDDFEMMPAMTVDDTGVWVVGRIWKRHASTIAADSCPAVERTGPDGGGYSLLMRIDAKTNCPSKIIIYSFAGEQTGRASDPTIRNIVPVVVYASGALWTLETSNRGSMNQATLMYRVDLGTGDKTQTCCNYTTIVADGDSIWGTRPNPYGQNSTEYDQRDVDIARYDTVSNKEIAQLTVHGAVNYPEQAVVAGGAYWLPVQSDKGHRLYRVDESTNAVTTPYQDDDAVGRLPEITVMGDGHLFVGIAPKDAIDSSVWAFDLSNGTRSADVTGPRKTPASLSFLKGVLWISFYDEPGVYWIKV